MSGRRQVSEDLMTISLSWIFFFNILKNNKNYSIFSKASLRKLSF